jgi:hypothetical protein
MLITRQGEVIEPGLSEIAVACVSAELSAT